MSTDQKEVKEVNFRPFDDRVLILPDEAEQKTASGIIIPDTAKEKPQRGTVVKAGPGMDGKPMQVGVGERVLYSKYAGTDLQIDGVDYKVMRQTDCLGAVD